MSLDVAALHDAALALLRTCVNLDIMDGSVDDAGQPGVRLDPDGRAHMYAVLYTSPGWLTSDRAVAAPSTLGWSFQVTFVFNDAPTSETDTALFGGTGSSRRLLGDTF